MGLGLAKIYAERGDDVVLLARDTAENLQAAVDNCREVAPDPGQIIAAEFLDVTAFDTLQSDMDRFMAQFGVPDLLILCAGVAVNSTFLDTPREKMEWVVGINFSGSSETARAVLPPMVERGSGQIVFFSSMAGMMGIYGYGAYSVSKFAVNGLVQVLRQELLDTGVSINLVAPPEVATPMIAAESASVLPQTRFLKDLGGTLQPEVVVKRIAEGIDKNQQLIIPSARARLMAEVARHFPWLFGKTSEMLLRWKF
jgi:3-dehydrosphinganine reductase